MTHQATDLLTPCVVWLGMLALCSPLVAEEADVDERFAERYGEELRQVQQTRSSSDDLELARRMIEQARERTDQSEWLERLSHEAVRLSHRRRGGQDVALEALRLRAEHLPEARLRSLERIARIYRRQFSRASGRERREIGRDLLEAQSEAAKAIEEAGYWERADEGYRQALQIAAALRAEPSVRKRIQNNRDRVQARLRRRKRIEQLREHVQQQPPDTEAVRSLAKLLVITGQLQTAAEHRDRLDDSPLKRRLTLGIKDPAELTEEEALELGRWFREMASEEPEPGPVPLIKLAHQCYDRYLQLHVANDEDRRSAERARSQLRDQLDRLGIDPPPPPVDKLAVERPSADKPPRRHMRRRLPGRRFGRARGSNRLFEALRAPEQMRQNPGAGPEWTEILPKLRPEVVEEASGWRLLPQGGLEGRVPDTGETATLVPPLRIVRGSYRLHLRFETRGQGRLRLILPAADRAVELVIAAGAPEESGFHGIEDHTPDQSRLRPAEVESGRLQTLGVQVTPEEGDEIRLSAGLNAQPLAAWEGPVSGLVASPPDADGPGPALALKLESPSDRDASAVSGREAFRIEFSALNLKLLEKGEARMIRPRRPGPSGR